MKNDTVVLGLGNPLMADEGIGIEIITILKSASGDYPEVDFLDSGCGGMTLLHYLEGRKKAIIIDCAFMGTEPGTMKRFKPEDVKSVKKLAHHSLHEVDILKVIELAKQLGDCPQEIIFFAIEPEKIEQQQSLTPLLQNKLNEYIQTIRQEL